MMDQTDKDHMMRTNQYYIAQLSFMEIKNSELNSFNGQEKNS